MKIKLIDFGLSNWIKNKGDTYLPNRAKYGAPQTINGNFNCCNNPDLHSLEGIGKVEGIIYTDF